MSRSRKDGKRIGVVAPSSRLLPDVRDRLPALASEVGAEVVFHPQCFESSGHFAGPDAARAEAFVEFANDDGLDAVWFGRGGYGAFRLIESILPRLRQPAQEKIYLGYSDAGALLGALYAARIGRVAHGPMPSDLRRESGEATVRRALRFLADGDTRALEPTLASGVTAAAFNITILAHLIGTPWLPDLRGHVLMLEEVAEPMYRIDRALGQIVSMPELRRVAGIRLGRCSEIPENDPDFGQDEVTVARYWCARAGIPYLGRADIGHDAGNRVVPFGTWRPSPRP